MPNKKCIIINFSWWFETKNFPSYTWKRVFIISKIYGWFWKTLLNTIKMIFLRCLNWRGWEKSKVIPISKFSLFYTPVLDLYPIKTPSYLPYQLWLLTYTLQVFFYLLLYLLCHVRWFTHRLQLLLTLIPCSSNPHTTPQQQKSVQTVFVHHPYFRVQNQK